MENVIIACQTLRDELTKVMEETACTYPVVWIDSKYHMDPHLLREKLQSEIDQLTEADNLLFAFGCCGNGLIGLKATTGQLIIPKTDDCISMVLSHRGEQYHREKATYFLTKGWMESEKSLMHEFWHSFQRYGEKRAKRIFQIMLKNYRYLMLIDTGAYDLEQWSARAREIAQNIDLELVLRQGDLWLLRQLLMGPYDQDFCVIPRGATVGIADFGYSQGAPAHQSM